MPDNLYNLLSEQLIDVTRDGTATAALSLPQVMAALVRGEQLEFSALQPHQFHAWHAFLTQLGALAAHHQGTDIGAMGEAAQWQKALLALTAGRSEPWTLIVPDLGAPAFMQPPVPEGSLAQWDADNCAMSPDAIDLLETAKNHDVKAERIAVPRPEHWIFALITLQTMQGFSGRYNYGIARMNGGIGNRPGFAAARDLAWSTRFIRDATLLLEARSAITTDRGFDPESGLTLLWLEAWNGIDQISLAELDPFFIEICRRIRLIESRGAVAARWTTSKATRIAAKEQKGNLGDPWVPVRIEDGAALTARGLDYELVQRVLFGGEFRPSPASIPRQADGDEPLLSCQLFARDQGKTDGYYERLVPISRKARLRLITEDGRRQLGDLSKARLADVRDVASKVLRPALAALLQAGPEKLDFGDTRIFSFAAPFDRKVDGVFFRQLFDDIDRDPAAARLKWLHQLIEFARDVLENAKQSAPVPSARLFRARAAADRVFNGAAYRMRAAAGEFIQRGGNDERTTE